MTLAQQILTIAICALATMATRFLPFLVFREGRPTPPLVIYLGKALPSAIFAMLVSIAAGTVCYMLLVQLVF